MNRILIWAILFAILGSGCSRYVKTAFVNGHYNVVIRSHEDSWENDAWAFVTKRYGIKAGQVKRPEAYADKLDFVQTAYEVLERSRRETHARLHPDEPSIDGPIKEVVGFYNPTSNLIIYTTGEYGTLAHEYCHSLNHQLKLGLTQQQDEYFCDRVGDDYEGQKEMNRLRHENRELKHMMNSRSRR